MKYKFIILLLIIFCFKLHTKELTIGVPEWQGYTNADGSGVYFDLLRKAYPDDTFNIKIDSYNRTLANFHNNKLDIVIGVFREDIQQGIFPHWFLDTEAPITAFYNPEKTQLTHLSDLEDLTVSWIRGYKFNHFIPYVANPYLVNKISTGFELVTKNRVNVFIDYPYNVPQKYQQDLASLEVMPSRHIYLAFQRNASGSNLAEQYDKMMPELRDSGVLADIFSQSYESSKLSNFDPNKERFIIKTSVAKKQPRSITEPIEDKVLDLLIDKNESYNIELQIESLQSINKQATNNTCYSNKLKNEQRQQKYIFSRPMSIYIGLRLFSKYPLNITEPVNIESLLKENPDKTLSVIKGRSYSNSIDKQLTSLQAAQVDFMLGDIDSYLDTFSANKNNLIIEYPSTIAHSAILSNSSELYSYQIKGAYTYNLGHIMCKKTKKNKQFIQSINKTLTSLYSSQYFIDILYSEADKNSQKDFYRYYDKEFKVK